MPAHPRSCRFCSAPSAPLRHHVARSMAARSARAGPGGAQKGRWSPSPDSCSAGKPCITVLVGPLALLHYSRSSGPVPLIGPQALEMFSRSSGPVPHTAVETPKPKPCSSVLVEWRVHDDVNDSASLHGHQLPTRPMTPRRSRQRIQRPNFGACCPPCWPQKPRSQASSKQS